MNRITLILICLIVFTSACSRKAGTGTIRSLQFNRQLSIPNYQTGEVTVLRDSCIVYYQNKLILYRIPYGFTQLKGSVLVGDSVFISDAEENVAYREVRYKDYVFERNGTNGIEFDSGRPQYKATFGVDSFLAARSFRTLPYFIAGEDMLIATRTFKDSVIEVYIPKAKADNSYPDTTYLCYGAKYDAVAGVFRGLKPAPRPRLMLYEVSSVYNPVILRPGTTELAMPRRVIFFRIKKSGVPDSKKIQAIFLRFRDMQI